MVYAKLHRGKVTHLNNFICAYVWKLFRRRFTLYLRDY